MKFTIETASLTAELFKIQGIASSKTTMPILSNVLLEADTDGTIKLYASDLDLSLASKVLGKVERAGKIAVRAKDLYEALKNLRASEVTLEKEENHWVALTSSTVRARLVGMDPTDFPALLSADEVEFVRIPAGKLMRMIDRTLFSVSSDEGRPNLTGALLKAEGNTLLMVSTDGHRLSKVEIDARLENVPKGLVDGVIVPKKGLSELKRTVELVEDIAVGLHGSHVVFRQKESTMFVRFIDGTFPVFKSVVPEEKEERKAIIDRSDFLSKIKFVSLFSNTKTHNMTLKMEDSTCTISAQDPDKGECQEQLPVNFSGPPVKAGFNYKYLVDVLSVVDTEQVTIEVIDTLLPTILHEIAAEPDERSLFIVMPMRL